MLQLAGIRRDRSAAGADRRTFSRRTDGHSARRRGCSSAQCGRKGR
jgi:hypothetical protein